MKTFKTVAVVLAAAMALGASACGSSTSTHDIAAQVASTSSTTASPRPTRDVDQLVRIDSGQMHIHCTGAGNATVVLIAGWDGGDGSWDAIEPGITNQARVCSYAKLGTGNSGPAPVTQTFATQAADLHAVLRASNEPGPYVVLGHSFGGAEAVTFASQYSDEVAGLLLLDASPTTWPATVCSVPAFQPVCDLMHDPGHDAERLDVFSAFNDVSGITSLGGLPMTVMTGAHRQADGLTLDELARLDAVWAQGQQHWSSLSSNSSIVTVEHTGHHIEIDQPAMVSEALLKLLPRK
jgi:pimeloyl-ACP methyl ester carboxylesterase